MVDKQDFLNKYYSFKEYWAVQEVQEDEVQWRVRHSLAKHFGKTIEEIESDINKWVAD